MRLSRKLMVKFKVHLTKWTHTGSLDEGKKPPRLGLVRARVRLILNEDKNPPGIVRLTNVHISLPQGHCNLIEVKLTGSSRHLPD